MNTSNRPLSPHLTIYRPQISTVLSITHRITGLALYAGMALLVLWLATAAYAPEKYAPLHECLGSWIGKLLLVGWTFAFYYHLASGIRHLFWDMGKGFTIPVMHRTGWLVVISSIMATLFTWGFINASVGG